jgi:hypothetical protein
MSPLIVMGYALALVGFAIGVGIGFFRAPRETTVVYCEQKADGQLRCPAGFERFEQAGAAPAAGGGSGASTRK